MKIKAEAIKESTPAQAPSRRRQTSTVPLTNPPPLTAPDPASSNASTDWYAEAHSVAEDALANEQSKGAKRGFEHKMPSATDRETPSIFDPPPVHSAGTWDGPDRFYVTDNCYYEWDRAAQPPPTLLDNRLKTPVCKRPPKGGGDAMFKDLTPDYLKARPEPQSH